MTSSIGGNACGVESFGLPRDQSASLFVGDLHPDVCEIILHQTFSPFGPIHSVRVCRDRGTLRSLRYGYVNFVNLADAENAMETLIFQDLLGRPMRIMFSQRDSTLRKSGIGNICIKGLSGSIDGVSLYDTFSNFGKILSCKVVCDENGSKGYGFVHFATYEAAEKAIKTLDGMLLDDQLVSIGHFKTFEERQAEQKATSENMQQDKKKRYPGVSVYVSNLPYSFSGQQLYTAFSPFGTIINAKVMVESDRSKGFGFVSFSTLEDATTAVSVMNGRIVGGRALRVTLSHHSEQKTELENQDSSSEVLPALSSDQPDVPAGQFSSAVPQDPTRPDLCPTNQLALQPSTRQTAVGVLAEGQRLRPLMSVILLDAVAIELPRLLVSQVLVDYMVNEAVFGPCHTIKAQDRDVCCSRRLLALPGPSRDTRDVLDLSEDIKGQTLQTSVARPKTTGSMRSLSTKVHHKSASLHMASQSHKILPANGATAPVRTERQELRDSPHQSPSMWGRWFWVTLDGCLKSRCLSCPTSWSIINLHSTRRSYKWSCRRSPHLQK